MDSTLNRIGLYEVLSVMLSGVIVLLAGIYLNLFTLFGSVDELQSALFETIESDVLKAVAFIVTSYFVGIVLQEVSAWIDGKLFQFQDKIKSDFLNVHVFENPLEMEDFKKMSNRILNKKADNQHFDENDQLYVFLHCKNFLEVHNKEGNSETFDSLCDMSRNLMVAFPVLLLWHMFFYMPYVDISDVLIFSSLTVIFYQRAKKYAKLRVRAILRHYKMLTQQTP